MKGYLRMLTADFDDWNETMTETYINIMGDDSAVSYTRSNPDVDPDYIWARVEHDFIEGDIKSKEEALTLGMVTPQPEE